MDYLLNVLNSIGLFIDSLLYSFISFFYQVFIAISRANLFSETTIRTITDRIFTVLGIVMLFYIAYELLMLVITPEKLTSENKIKTLITKFITSIILIVLLPTIFKYMQVFQNNIISSNIIGNVILGSSSGNSSDTSVENSGTLMALSIGQAFFHPYKDNIEYSYLDCIAEGEDNPTCDDFIKVYDEALANKNPGYFFGSPVLKKQLNLNTWEQITSQDRQMKYYAIFSTVAAFLALRMIIIFSIDIGVHVAKLGFLQVIAPIPIAQNITKSESITQSTWFKELLKAYLEIFMKLIIIYFSMYAIGLVPDVISNLWTSGESNGFIQMLASVVVILGILQFAKDGPELFQKVFNIQESLSVKKRFGDNYAQRGAAVLGGGAAGFASNVWNSKNASGERGLGRSVSSGFGGLVSGAYKGFRNSENISSWGEVGSNINKTRGEIDASRTSRETKRNMEIERGLQFKGGDGQRGVVPGVTRLVGKASAIPGNIQDFKKRGGDWLRGGISLEKQQATSGAINDIKGFYDTVLVKNKDIPAMESARNDDIKDLYSSEFVIPEIIFQQYKDKFQHSALEKSYQQKYPEIQLKVKDIANKINSGVITVPDMKAQYGIDLMTAKTAGMDKNSAGYEKVLSDVTNYVENLKPEQIKTEYIQNYKEKELGKVEFKINSDFKNLSSDELKSKYLLSIDEYKKDISESIKGNYKQAIREQKIMTMEKNQQTAVAHSAKLVESVKNTLNTLGTETSKQILANANFANIQEFEKSFEKIGTTEFSAPGGYYDKLEKLEGSLKDELTRQRTAPDQPEKKDKK